PRVHSLRMRVMLLAPPSPRPAAAGRRARPGAGGRRRGTATLWMLGILMVLTGSMAAVLEIYRYQVVRGEMQNSADAAATAAARELVDDSLLTGDPQAMAD